MQHAMRESFVVCPLQRRSCSGPLFSSFAAILLAFAAMFGAQIAAADLPLHDGDLIAREPCSRTVPSYADYRARQLATFAQEAEAARAQQLPIRSAADAAAALLSEAEYAARHDEPGIVCERLSYASDGLRVIAYLWRPSSASAAQRLPLIIFNRGGALEDSKLRPNTQFGFDRFVKAGYVVLGSQYRGNDGGEGKEEMGGADVHDVTSLLTLGRALPYVDTDNVFALGYSRGAMMTLLTIRGGAKLNAAALVGAPSDLTKALASGDARNLATFRQLIPNFDADPQTALRARSALYWPEDLSVPLLLLQGGADPLVSVSTHTLPLAAKLQQLHKTYELVIYDGDTHGVMINGRDRDARILEWFARFRRTAAKP
jgi:dipeptidyl aminopeptidase/acylaminoacyl peptidase